MVCHRIRNASVLEKIWWKEVDNMDWAYWLTNNGNVLDDYFDNHALNVIASFICALLIPLLAAKIIEHSKILSFLLVGKYPNKEVKNAFAEDRK